MPEIIRSRLNQKTLLTLASGKTVELLAKARVEVSKEDLEKSSQLKNLIKRGDVVLEVSRAKAKASPAGEGKKK